MDPVQRDPTADHPPQAHHKYPDLMPGERQAILGSDHAVHLRGDGYDEPITDKEQGDADRVHLGESTRSC